ncbi:MAG: ExbD/TolR family protein [Acidobacteria bacterium]|nr:ExbD/TolR family protein [Acidobacteriota bacterium]
MAPVETGGRRSRGRRVSTSLSEINVIPLVDVMLVLLIIFMVAAPMMQRGVEVNLPQSRTAPRMSEERMYVTVPLSYRTDNRVYIDDEAVPAAVLSERIRQAMTGKDSKEVFLRGEATVQLQELMAVMDLLKEGGIERVGIVAMPAAPARGTRR